MPAPEDPKDIALAKLRRAQDIAKAWTLSDEMTTMRDKLANGIPTDRPVQPEVSVGEATREPQWSVSVGKAVREPSYEVTVGPSEQASDEDDLIRRAMAGMRRKSELTGGK